MLSVSHFTTRRTLINCTTQDCAIKTGLVKRVGSTDNYFLLQKKPGIEIHFKPLKSQVFLNLNRILPRNDI